MINDSLIEKLIKESRAFRDSENAGMLHISKVIAIIHRHYNGKPAIEGKPIELQTRDELLAYIRNHNEDKLDMVKKPVAHSDEVVELVKDMSIAHRMSLTPFCDSSDWDDRFEYLYKKAIDVLSENAWIPYTSLPILPK